ncbi:G protein-coupled receptor [Caenorhabditis elegans]|uniref:G protein-coupled receptor n=1 Tax=Caenorhabditis elegans TaxID=6239 RepID=O17559_CAEEL|nr:G protein-coupled receptor [Caenorhabditis elegans]CAB03822.2 G protein-coupled receptor [Caenorhabditis elegans]|eukprot:NP_505865.2 Uncharacterized protein CELE_C03E10.3 [Caenorhabditis elegans]
MGDKLPIVQVVIQLVTLIASIYSHWQFIKVAVVRTYFFTFTRGQLGTISCAYVLITFGTFFMAICKLIPDTEEIQRKFENVNVTMGFIINFTTFFYFLDAHIGLYKKMFEKEATKSFMLVFFTMVVAYICFIIPEFTHHGNLFQYSDEISIGMCLINIVMNIFVRGGKKVAMERELGKQTLKVRFQISEAIENCRVMFYITTTRFLILLCWIIFIYIPSDLTEPFRSFATVIFEILKSIEAIVFPSVFLHFHDRIVRHIFYLATKDLKDPPTLEPRPRFDGSKLLAEMSQTETIDSMKKSWEKHHKKFMKDNKRNVPSTSNQILLEDGSREILE